MITLLTGDNSFEIEREQRRLEAEFSGTAEKFDGESITLNQLPGLLMGATLFAERRLVIVKRLSDNADAWTALGDWLDRVSSDIHLLLIEPKPDKRTKTYKQLQKLADIKEYKQWTERDRRAAEQWTINEAKQKGLVLDQKAAALIVQRSMIISDKPGGAIIDQWRIRQAVDKLALLGDATTETINEIIEPSPVENVFDLFDAALGGDRNKLKTMLTNLALTQDPHRLFGLLSGQAFNLLALSVADKTSAEVAKDMAVHPYVLSKLSPHAKKLGRGGVKKVVAVLADADYDMKTTGHDPWLFIERALMKVAGIKR